MKPNTNLSEAQMNAIDTILSKWVDNNISNLMDNPIDGRVWKALRANELMIYNHDRGEITITHYGIQSYCATYLTKYDGPSHEIIHAALNNYQRLFN